MNLSAATLPTLPPSVHVSAYDRAAHAPGVVHLGLGAFHRAHQAMVFDQLLSAGDMRWGIHGVGMTRPDLVNQLKTQDSLYAVRVADGQGVKWHVPGALWRTSVATTERDAVVAAIAAPTTRTYKTYYKVCTSIQKREAVGAGMLKLGGGVAKEHHECPH